VEVEAQADEKFQRLVSEIKSINNN
jgi:hypothetical protein